MTDEQTKNEATEEKKEEAVVEDKAQEAPKNAPAKKRSQYVRTAKGKKRTFKTVPRARAYVTASLNNTMITVTDPNGNAIAWSTAGACGFKGPKKATPYAASVLVGKIADQLEALGTKELSVFVKGIGGGRDSSVRTLNSKGFNITSIKELTPVPHNGCRPRRPRRV